MAVFVFSGQGAQYEGMGKSLSDSSYEAKMIFEACSTYVGYDILKLQTDQLNQTQYAQIATVATSLAALRAFQSNITLPSVKLAGFSLGEYSMLGANNLYPLDVLMPLLNYRSTVMQETCAKQNGCMYAIIGLDNQTVEDACFQLGEGNVFPANYNAKNQLVISGDKKYAAVVSNFLKTKGAKRTVLLPVSGAFHTPFMQPAADRLHVYLKSIPEGRPIYVAYSNVSASAIDFPNTKMVDYLPEQMLSPVHFVKEIEALIQSGETTFIEFGPKKTLSALIKKIDKTVNVLNVEDESSLNTTLKTVEKLI